MATKIQIRRDTATNWTAQNPTLSDGEMGFETDTGYMKIGDGTTAWQSLTYLIGAPPGVGGTLYTLPISSTGNNPTITLTGNDGTTDPVQFAAGTGINLSEDGSVITTEINAFLSNLSDVAAASPNSGDVLQWSGSAWDSVALSASNVTGLATVATSGDFNDLNDVNSAMSPTDGQVLSWDAGNSRWDASSAAGALNDLSDVNLGSPSTGNILHYNQSGEWEATSSIASTLILGSLRVSGTTGQDYTRFGTLTGTDGDIIPHNGNFSGGAMWYHSDTNHNFIANFDNVFLNASESCKLTIVIDNDQEGRDTICTGIQINGFDKLNVQWASGSAPTVGTALGYDIIEFTIVNEANNALSNLGQTDIQQNVHVFADHKSNVSQTLAGLSDVDLTQGFGDFIQYDTLSGKYIKTNSSDRYSFFTRRGFGALRHGLYQEIDFSSKYENFTGTDGDVLTVRMDTGGSSDGDTDPGHSGNMLIESIDYNFVLNIENLIENWNEAFWTDGYSRRWLVVVDNNLRDETRVRADFAFNSLMSGGEQIIINGVTITAETSQPFKFMDEINNAGIPGLYAYRDARSRVVLSCVTTDSSDNGITFSYGGGARVHRGTVQRPTVTGGNTLIINGTTVTFSGGDWETITADINNAGIAGVRAWYDNAAINSTQRIQINSADADLVIDAGSTALTELGMTAGTYTDREVFNSTTFGMAEGTYGSEVRGSPGKGLVGLQIEGWDLDVIWAGGQVPTPKLGRYDVYEIEIFADAGVKPYHNMAFIRHWNESDIKSDLTGSVFADDSTLLIDGINGTIVNPRITGGVIENNIDLFGATGTVVHDTSTTHIFYHSGLNADFTANFTNLSLNNNEVTSMSLILEQGATAYIPTAVQIDGAAQTLLWQGGSAPTGTANGVDHVTFSLIYNGSSYTVLGQLASYS